MTATRRRRHRRSWTFEQRRELKNGPAWQMDPPRKSTFVDMDEMREAYEDCRDDLIDCLTRRVYQRSGYLAPWAIREFEPELLDQYPKDPEHTWLKIR